MGLSGRARSVGRTPAEPIAHMLVYSFREGRIVCAGTLVGQDPKLTAPEAGVRTAFWIAGPLADGGSTASDR